MKRYLTLFSSDGTKVSFQSIDLNDLPKQKDIMGIYVYVQHGVEHACLLHKNYSRSYLHGNVQTMHRSKVTSIRTLWEFYSGEDNRNRFIRRKDINDDWAPNVVDKQWAQSLVLKKEVKK